MATWSCLPPRKHTARSRVLSLARGLSPTGRRRGAARQGRPPSGQPAAEAVRGCCAVCGETLPTTWPALPSASSGDPSAGRDSGTMGEPWGALTPMRGADGEAQVVGSACTSLQLGGRRPQGLLPPAGTQAGDRATPAQGSGLSTPGWTAAPWCLPSLGVPWPCTARGGGLWATRACADGLGAVPVPCADFQPRWRPLEANSPRQAIRPFFFCSPIPGSWAPQRGLELGAPPRVKPRCGSGEGLPELRRGRRRGPEADGE